jgi:hypothetical protein
MLRGQLVYRAKADVVAGVLVLGSGIAQPHDEVARRVDRLPPKKRYLHRNISGIGAALRI